MEIRDVDSRVSRPPFKKRKRKKEQVGRSDRNQSIFILVLWVEKTRMFSTSIVAPSNRSSISGPQLSLLMRAASTSNPNSKVDCYLSSKVSFNSLKSKAATRLLFKIPNGFVSKRPFRFRPVMELQDCTVKKEVDVPVSVAYNCYSNREDIPKWMPFISSVKVLEDKPDQSRWTLRYKAFGRDIEFSWLARNLQPIPNQKIHWRSLEGLPNSGAVRFYPRGPSSCLIELTVSYEVPQLLSPVASALQPFLESLLLRGLERFTNFAKNSQLESTN